QQQLLLHGPSGIMGAERIVNGLVEHEPPPLIPDPPGPVEESGPSTSAQSNPAVSSSSSLSANHPFRLAPTSDSKVVLPKETAPASATETLPWLENGRELQLSIDDTLKKVHEKAMRGQEEWQTLDTILKNYLSNQGATRLMVEIVKPAEVSMDVIWNRMQYEMALRKTHFNSVAKKYSASLNRMTRKMNEKCDSTGGCMPQVYFEALMRTRMAFENVALIEIEVLSNLCRLSIALLDKMFGKNNDGKTIGKMYTEMDETDKNSISQMSRLTEIRLALRIENGPVSTRELINRWREFERYAEDGAYPADATNLSKRFHKAPVEIFGKCHILFDIVDGMKKLPRFQHLTYCRRIQITLAMFYIQGHLDAEPGKYSVDDLAKIDITCNMLQQLFGTAASDPEEFQLSMGMVIAAIRNDMEIQDLMNRIMLDELQIDSEMIAARRRLMQINPSSFVRNTPPNDASTQEPKDAPSTSQSQPQPQPQSVPEPKDHASPQSQCEPANEPEAQSQPEPEPEMQST
ncbi:hypothetical protein PFISCL1PPCAC_26737, partial [Pristionchus fissidentatus]